MQLHGPFETSWHGGDKDWYVVDWYGAFVAKCGSAELARALKDALNASSAVHLHV